MSFRHLARAITLQVLFMWDFNGEDLSQINFYIDYNLQEFGGNEIDRDFVEELVVNTIKYKEESDRFINRYAREWKVERLAVVDREILRMAIFEMFHRKDIPHKVALNEAVELEKQYRGESSQKFVSGVLGALYEDHFKHTEISVNSLTEPVVK